jgi:hypothetical protein
VGKLSGGSMFSKYDGEYFTDQKWMDFLPFLLSISLDLGLNVAPWNFYEREIVNKDNRFFVKNRINKLLLNFRQHLFIFGL